MTSMKLRDFVKNSLIDVLNGIKDAQRDAEVGDYIAMAMTGGTKFPPDSGVVSGPIGSATSMRFDVAVTVERSDTGGAGAKVAIGVVSGSIGGNVTDRNQNVTRIQFAVPLFLPSSEDTRREK